jgi:hypothetical protein
MAIGQQITLPNGQIINVPAGTQLVIGPANDPRVPPNQPGIPQLMPDPNAATTQSALATQQQLQGTTTDATPTNTINGVPASVIGEPTAPVPSLLPPFRFTSDGTGINVSRPPSWGIYSGSQLVIEPDTIVAYDFKREWALADYPVEQGGFETYDKVATPTEHRVRMASGGSLQNREALLQQIDFIAGNLQLYTIVTPEAVYVRCNIVRYDYRRTAVNGLGLIVIDVMLKEVRIQTPPNQMVFQAPQLGPAPITNPAFPGSTSVSNAGNAAPVSASPEMLSFIQRMGGPPAQPATVFPTPTGLQ